MENITWLGHASFMFVDKNSGNRIYYVDPFHFPKDRDLTKADIIFVTHAHSDHLSPEDIGIILKDDTTIVATKDSLDTLNITQDKFPVVPNKEYDVKGFKFSTVPAYNSHPEKLSFHPQANGWVGYIFELNGLRIYHAGDTDFIPEMKTFDKLSIDVAMLPMGGTYTMDVNEMIKAANAIKAKTTIPMHYKGLLGEKASEAEDKLKKGVTNSKVLIFKELS